MVNPHAALVFFWGELERQIRIEGFVVKTSPQESDSYFRSRPFGSQLGAWASPQSEVIKSRQILEENIEQLQQKYLMSPQELLPQVPSIKVGAKRNPPQ